MHARLIDPISQGILKIRGLYWFGQKVPTSSSSLLLVLLALKVCSKGYKRAREGNDPKSLVEGVNGC